MNEFGKRLSARRRAFGRTQAELAQHMNVTVGAVGNWESGTREPNLDCIIAIAQFLDVTIDWLVGMPDATTRQLKTVYPKEIIIDGKRFSLVEKNESEGK